MLNPLDLLQNTSDLSENAAHAGTPINSALSIEIFPIIFNFLPIIDQALLVPKICRFWRDLTKFNTTFERVFHSQLKNYKNEKDLPALKIVVLRNNFFEKRNLEFFASIQKNKTIKQQISVKIRGNDAKILKCLDANSNFCEKIFDSSGFELLTKEKWKDFRYSFRFIRYISNYCLNDEDNVFLRKVKIEVSSGNIKKLKLCPNFRKKFYEFQPQKSLKNIKKNNDNRNLKFQSQRKLFNNAIKLQLQTYLTFFKNINLAMLSNIRNVKDLHEERIYYFDKKGIITLDEKSQGFKLEIKESIIGKALLWTPTQLSELSKKSSLQEVLSWVIISETIEALSEKLGISLAKDLHYEI